MRKIGTVTKYYEFIEPSLQVTLDTILENATNYNDFLNQLSVELSDPKSPGPLAHIGAVLSCSVLNYEANRRISDVHGDLPSVIPWIIAHDDSTRLEVLENLIASNQQQWILFQAYLRKAERLYLVPEAHDCLQKAKEIIESNPGMKCFRAGLYSHEMFLHGYENDTEGVYQLGEEALECARNCDDILLETALLVQQSIFLINTDIHRAMNYNQSAYTLAKELGTPNVVCAAMQGIGVLSTIIGEYDLAMQAFTECVDIIQSQELPLCHLSIDISQVLSDLEDGKSAIEWAKESLEVEENKQGKGGLDEHICPQIAMARGLIITGRHEDALDYIYRAHEFALRSGQEAMLADYYYIQGLYDVVSGDVASGIDLLTRAIEICERTTKSQRLKNRCLLALTKAEIDMFDFHDRKEHDPDDSGPWMTRLGQECRKKGFHGLKMQYLLLKAEFQEKLGLNKVAMETLETALNSFDSPGVKSIQEKIRERMRNLRETPLSP